MEIDNDQYDYSHIYEAKNPELIDSKNYEKFVGIIAKNHKSERARLVQICVNHLESVKCVCVCNYVKMSVKIDDILEVALLKCKNVCNFCQFHNKKKLFDVSKSLKYQKLKEIFGIDYFLGNKEIIQFVVDHNSVIPFKDLEILLKSNSDIIVNKILMETILKSFVISGYNQDTDAFRIIKLIVTNDKHFEKHTQILTNFVLRAIKDKNMTMFKEPNLNNIICSDFIVDYILECNEVDIFIEIMSMCKAINISHKHIKKLTVYEYDVIKNMIKKMVNGVEVVSYFNKDENFHIGSVTLKVNPINFLDSILTLNDELTIKLLSTRYRTHIKYMNEQGDLGYDAGGLTKEFYEILSSEIKKITKEVDGFLMFNDENISPNKLRLIGTFLCRSIYIENISPSINFHPIIGFFLMNGGNGLNLFKMIEYLQFFDIDYVRNLFKIHHMSDEEYNDFLYMQCEDPIEKTQYIITKLTEKYVNKNTKIIINAFNYTAQNLWHTKLLNSVVLYKFITKNDKYDIIGNGIHSLKNNLLIISQGKNYVDEDDIKFESNTVAKYGEIFKSSFLEVLAEINDNDLDKLKFFLKFWYGTSSIISFTERKSTIDLKINPGDFDCFESSTCFDRLYIHISRSLFKNPINLKKFIMNAIDMSIENQKRCEEIGAYMQVM